MSDRPITRAIRELREELARIDQVIRVLESVARGKPRRGRPPKILAEATRGSTKRITKPRPKASKS